MENVHDLIQYFLDTPGETETERLISEQLKHIMNWMPGGFFIYRADGDEELLYANEATQRMFLCENMEELRALTGNSFRGIVHPEELDAVEESIKKQIANSQADLDYVEYRIIRKDGSVRWVDDYGHFIHSEGGDVFCVFIGDNTEDKLQRFQREKNLKSRMEAYHQELEGISEEYLRRLEVIEGLSTDYESIFYVDLDDNTIQTYQVSHGLDGAFDQESRMRAFDDFVQDYTDTWVYPEDRERVREFLSPEGMRARLSAQRVCDLDYRIQRGAEAEYFQFHLVSGGRPSQVILASRSVDAFIRRSIEQREVLEDALHQANSAVIAKNTFLANMSHDMRTPMNAILGFTALAKRHLDDGNRTGGYLDMIEAAGNQLLRLVNEVLELARMESGKVQLEETLDDLRQVARAAMRAHTDRADEKGVALALDLDLLKHPMAYCDGKKLEQLLSILTDNAVKYTPSGGHVAIVVEELECASPGYGTYMFSVRDDGAGISEDFLDRVFTPFERQRNTTSSRVPGTGLGLAIAKGIADTMGGTLSVESKLGEGSCFSAVFTFRRQTTPASTGPSASGGHSAGIGKILVVEDNDLNVEIERELLECEGYTVDVAEDGSVAVEMVRRAPAGEYAIIFMDIQMPVMDGYEATRAIRALEDPEKAHIPIVAVSANAFDEDKRKSSAYGMNDHIPKPVDISRLVEAIHTFTDAGRDRGEEA